MTRCRSNSLAVATLAAIIFMTGRDVPTQRAAAAELKMSPHVLVLRGDGIGSAAFGQPETTALAGLRHAIGAPKTRHPVVLADNCTVDAAMEWPSVTAYFFHGAFVGYATISLLGAPRRTADTHVATAAGLHVGDTLVRAAHLYGHSLSTSFAQGGSWFATTPTGTLAGYLTSEVDATRPQPRIADITAGSVGCPAASP